MCSAKARKERLESEFIITIPYFLWSAAICKGFELLKMSNIQQFRHMVPESEAFWKSSQIHFYAELVCLAKPSSLFRTLNRELGCTKRFYRENGFSISNESCYDKTLSVNNLWNHSIMYHGKNQNMSYLAIMLNRLQI